MRSYTLLYSKIWQQVAAMVIVPTATIIPFILVLTQYQNLSDTVVFIIIYAALGVIILLTLYVVFKHALVPVSITIHNWGFELIFKRKTLFNWVSKKDIPLDQIEFVTDDEDMNHSSRKFFTLKVRGERGKIILLAPKKAPAEEMEAFSFAFSNIIEGFNQNKSISAPIRQGSFYAGTFGKILTFTFIAAALLATVIKIAKPSSVEWYRMIWLYVIAAYWALNYFTARRKMKANKVPQ